MVATNDKIIIWWLTNRKHKKTFWLDTSLLPWWKKVMYPPKMMFTQVSEDILTKNEEKQILWPLTSFE